MTVSTTLNKIIYSGNGATTVFPFTFPGVAASDVQVFFTDTSGNVSLVSPSSYTLVLTPASGTNPTGAGGSVTYNPLGVPIPNGTFLTILRTLPLTQSTSLANQGTLYQPVEEAALDYGIMVSQQVLEVQSRALVVSVSDPTPSNLPAVAARKNLFLAFDSSGNPIASQPSGSNTPISSAMVPVVTAATLAAGRTAFGLGAMATEGIGAGLQDDGASNARVTFGLNTDAVSQSVGAGFHLTRRQVTAIGVTYTLPLSSTLFAGFGFWIQTNGHSPTLAVNAADNFFGAPSAQSLVLFGGQSVFVQTDAAGKWYVDYGPQIGFNSPLNLQINATVAANALTIAIKDRSGNDATESSPIQLAFRDSTIANGGPLIRSIITPLSITIPSTATIGTASAQTGRIYIAIFDNAGTPVLGVYNSLNSTGPSILCWDESNIATGTAIAAASNTPQIWYTNGSVTSKAFRIIGYIEFTEATAGTWATAPSLIQLWGPATAKPGDRIKLLVNSTLTQFANSTTAFVAGGPTQAISLRSAANVVRVRGNGTLALDQGGHGGVLQITRAAAGIGTIRTFSTGEGGVSTPAWGPTDIVVYDIPNSVSAQTYGFQTKANAGGFNIFWPKTNDIVIIEVEEIQI